MNLNFINSINFIVSLPRNRSSPAQAQLLLTLTSRLRFEVCFQACFDFSFSLPLHLVFPALPKYFATAVALIEVVSCCISVLLGPISQFFKILQESCKLKIKMCVPTLGRHTFTLESANLPNKPPNLQPPGILLVSLQSFGLRTKPRTTLAGSRCFVAYKF